MLTVQAVIENSECYETWNEKREPRLPFGLIVASILEWIHLTNIVLIKAAVASGMK